MCDSVHDNWVYAQAVDHERCQIILHTVYPHVDPPEYTDIIFSEVVVHHFEQQMMSGGPFPTNVLFDAEEASAYEVLKARLPLLERLRNYGWPVSAWSNLTDLVEQLTVGDAKCFEVHGTCGLHGFVFAKMMIFQPRSARALVTESESEAAD